MAKKKTKSPAGKIPKVTKIKSERIRVDAEIQSRVELDRDLIEEYAGEMAEGSRFPPVDLFYDGQTYWLADGFHRIAASRINRRGKPVAAVIHRGGKREAVLFAIKANVAHGLRRTNADKRRAVEKLLADENWVEWSDVYIARQCGVGKTLVSEIRESILSNRQDAHPKKKDDGLIREVVRGGKTYQMKVGNIGGGKGKCSRQSRGHLKPSTPNAYRSKPDPRTAIELSHDPRSAASLLVTVFEVPYLEELVKALTERIEQEKKGT